MIYLSPHVILTRNYAFKYTSRAVVHCLRMIIGTLVWEKPNRSKWWWFKWFKVETGNATSSLTMLLGNTPQVGCPPLSTIPDKISK